MGGKFRVIRRQQQFLRVAKTGRPKVFTGFAEQRGDLILAAESGKAAHHQGFLRRDGENQPFDALDAEVYRAAAQKNDCDHLKHGDFGTVEAQNQQAEENSAGKQAADERQDEVFDAVGTDGGLKITNAPI